MRTEVTRKLIVVALTLTFWLLAPPPSAAAQQVVVDGGAPTGDFGWLVSDDFSSAATFTVAPGGISFDAMRFWGMLATGTSYSPDMYWQILGDAGGSPDNGPVLAEGHAVASPTERTSSTLWDGYTSWQFDFGTGVQSLGAGTFWLALHDGVLDPASPDYTNSDLLWETTEGGSPFWSESISEESGWGPQGDRGLAFQLLDSQQVVATPEPTTFVLIATGLLAIGIMRRQRHASS